MGNVQAVLKVWYSFWHCNVVLQDRNCQIKKMKTNRAKLLLFIALTVGIVIGTFKGEEAKQKWVFKVRSKYDSKRLTAERRSIAKKGGIQLDDIELASYHNN